MSKKMNTKPAGNICTKCGSEAGAANFCPDCGSKVRGASTDEKRARLEEKGGGGRGIGPIIAIVAAIVLGGVGYVALKGGGVQRAQSVAATTTGQAGQAGGIALPVASFDGGQARYYEWDSPAGKRVKFFVLKSADGVIRSAFDACDVCFAAKKGYRQEGDFMVCNNCGQRFESVRVNEVRGGCNPSPVDRTIVDGNVVITAAALAAGEKYF